MINFSDGYSREFTRIINIVLDEIYSFFMDVGNNLDYQEIYGTVFPEHKQDDQISGMNYLKTIQRYIQDDFHHNLTPIYEYILYKVLYFVYDSSEDGFRLDDLISELLTPDEISKLDDEDTLKILKRIHNTNDLIGIIFEDVDFLQVGEMFEIYRNDPKILTDFLHVDLDYYQELMPEDIKLEFNAIKDDMSYQNKRIQLKNNTQFTEEILKNGTSF